MVAMESVQTVVQVPLKRLWAAMKDSSVLLPKVMPEVFATVESLEGDGSAGSVRILNFGPAVPMVKFIKERVESVDEANYTTVTSVIDGGFIGIVFSLYRVTVSYEPSGDGSSTTITWRLEYEPLVESPSLEESKMGALGTFHAIEAYLLSHNEEYNSGVEEAQFGETTQLHA
ncbi:major pollen allergen Aln g 1 isoform X1 [Selaginella moellendorffii]|nr:major pollen allergen Aln g 1 isoform X1 [Selaginella moellendorffii]|eukprot:XP_002988994.2 major pollen allergen Aln g 1 isoform X1 [Selaginella moellendorffii]